MVKSNYFENTDFQFQVYFNLGSNKDKMGQKPIQMKTMIQDKRVVISLDKKVEEKYWVKRDARHPFEKARIDSEATPMQQQNCKEINNKIQDVLAYCHDYANAVCQADAEGKTREHSAESFKEYILSRLNDERTNKDLEKFVNGYINKKEDSKVLAKGTLENHRTALKRLLAFCHDKNCVPQWKLFNSDFEDWYKGWAKGLQKPHKDNTICSTLSTFKVWINEAKDRGVDVPNACKKWKTKAKQDRGDTISLTDNEIQRIIDLDFGSEEVKSKVACNVNLKKVEEVRDLFVIACNSSLRFEDWGKNLHEAEILEGDIVKTFTQKTKKHVYFPYNEIIKSIVDKYGSFADLPSPPSCTSQAIRQLRLIARLADIDKWEAVGTHTARRSFVTNHIAKGARLDAVAAATGHTTQTLVMLYNKQDEIDRARSLAS